MRFFCWHKWGNWSELVGAYTDIHQHRVCKKCNKAQRRRAGGSNDYNLNMWNAGSSDTEGEKHGE